MKDKPIRSTVKAVTWRILATLTTIILVYIFTGKIVLALQIGFIEVIAKLIIYYLHERVWNRVEWGRA